MANAFAVWYRQKFIHESLVAILHVHFIQLLWSPQSKIRQSIVFLHLLTALNAIGFIKEIFRFIHWNAKNSYACSLFLVQHHYFIIHSFNRHRMHIAHTQCSLSLDSMNSITKNYNKSSNWFRLTCTQSPFMMANQCVDQVTKLPKTLATQSEREKAMKSASLCTPHAHTHSSLRRSVVKWLLCNNYIHFCSLLHIHLFCNTQ